MLLVIAGRTLTRNPYYYDGDIFEMLKQRCTIGKWVDLTVDNITQECNSKGELHGLTRVYFAKPTPRGNFKDTIYKNGQKIKEMYGWDESTQIWYSEKHPENLLIPQRLNYTGEK